MEDLYFVNDEHRNNFNELKQRFPDSGPEYRVANYISAHPMMYYKYRAKLLDKSAKGPVDWIVDYVFAQEEGEELPFDLTDSMYQMGLLGLNLYNGHEGLNLMHALGSFDEDNIKVFYSAVATRLKRR